MDISFKNRQLIAVEYPGTVINVKHMMKQFGGETALSKTFHNPTNRLELHFRPSDPYSKPVYGDKFTTASLVIEVVRRRRKLKQTSMEQVKNCSDKSDSYSIEFVGYVNCVYKFKALCDFQMLPAEYDTGGSAKSLLPKLIPNGLPNSAWLDEEVPLFVMPLLFSRFDSASNVYADGVKIPRKPVIKKVDQSVIGTSRRKRTAYAVTITFDCHEPCNEPREECLEMLKLYPQQLEIHKKIEELFKERPIWNKAGLMHKLNMDTPNIRYALSCAAYHFTNGPWRTLWVRFGYDPRTDSKAKKYQLLDIRLKPNIAIDSIDFTRSKAFDYYILPAKAQKMSSKAPSIKTDLLVPLCHENQETGIKNNDSKSPSYILAAGQLPSTRQCYYQLCDIYIEEVQKLVHQNDGHEQFCHEKDGWCEIGILDKCREIIMKEIERLSLQQKTEEHVTH